MPTIPRRRFLRSAVAVLAAGEAAAQAGDAPTGPVAAAGVLRRVVSTEITSMDPQRPTGQVTSDLAAELFTGLTYYDRNGRLAPGCATSWEASPDGLAWTFRLRNGLKWSDGRPLAARDFVFTLRRYLAPATGAAQSSRLESIRGARELRHGRGEPEALGVTAPDARTVRIELAHPDVELPTMLSAAYCVPAHVIEARGREWSRPEFLVGNGAYALDSWAPGAKVIKLRRNPHYHDAASVRIERVHWLTGYDDGTRLRLYRLGEVEVSTIEDSGNLGIARRELAAALRSSPEAAVGWIGINVERGRLADPRLRRALSLAIDRRILTDKVRALGEQPSDALLPPGLPGYAAPALPDYADWPMPRRIAAARELLRQAGIAPGSLPPIGLGYPTSPTGRKVFLAVAAMWKSIGIASELQPLEGRAYNAALDEGQFDAFSYASFAQVPTAVVFLDRFHSQSAINFVRWRNVEFDRLFSAAERQPTLAQRVAGFAAAERAVLRELPVIPLWVGASNRLVSPRVTGWVDHPGHPHPSQYLALR
jgi:ABC-type oligopeptide transport system substrate-binding subunit